MHIIYKINNSYLKEILLIKYLAFKFKIIKKFYYPIVKSLKVEGYSQNNSSFF